MNHPLTLCNICVDEIINVKISLNFSSDPNTNSTNSIYDIKALRVLIGTLLGCRLNVRMIIYLIGTSFSL